MTELELLAVSGMEGCSSAMSESPLSFRTTFEECGLEIPILSLALLGAIFLGLVRELSLDPKALILLELMVE